MEESDIYFSMEEGLINIQSYPYSRGRGAMQLSSYAHSLFYYGER